MSDESSGDPYPETLNATRTEPRKLFNPGSLLRSAKIEAVGKPVYLDQSYLTSISRYASDNDLRAATDIRRRIISGEELKPYYRVSTATDTLLLIHGVMHLHLSSPASKALLYLLQFENCVLFLRIWSHIYVDERPVGRTLSLDVMVARFWQRVLSGSLG